MYSKYLVVSALLLGAFAGPLQEKPVSRDLDTRSSHSSGVSFHGWGGHQSLYGFDDWYGKDDFSGHNFKQVVVKKEHELVCHPQQIEIIQQRLVVIQELAKKIITEQICEVETQTIVFEQFHGSLGGFKNDLRRFSGHSVGYDAAVTGHFNELIGHDGFVTSHNLGFKGHDVGSQTVVVKGNNWDDRRSHQSVNAAYFAARHAYNGLHFSDRD